MAAARSIAAVLLVALASTLTAQDTPTGQVVIFVLDPSGAVIPAAHVEIVRLPDIVPNHGDWLQYALHASVQSSTHADANGKAMVNLAKGNYAFTIGAYGFRPHLERIEVRDEPSQTLRTTLFVGGCTQCVEVDSEITIPQELASLDILIPLEPLRTMTPTAVRVRRR